MTSIKQASLQHTEARHASAFAVIVRTSSGRMAYTARAASSSAAWLAAANAQGDTPCGITVTPTGGAQ